MKQLLLVTLILAGLAVVACGPQPTPVPTEEPSEPPAGLPNPASQFCEEQGYKLEMREEAGGTAGYCIFLDGTECEEWAFYRGECGPGTPVP